MKLTRRDFVRLVIGTGMAFAAKIAPACEAVKKAAPALTQKSFGDFVRMAQEQDRNYHLGGYIVPPEFAKRILDDASSAFRGYPVVTSLPLADDPEILCGALSQTFTGMHQEEERLLLQGNGSGVLVGFLSDEGASDA